MAPEGHLSYSSGPNICTERTKPCSVRVHIDPIPPKALRQLLTCHRQRSSRPVAPTSGKSVRVARTRLTDNRLRVFWRVVCALLGASGGPERETRPVPSEKWAVRWGSERDEMRMITASFTRVREQWPGHSCLHFSLKYQRLVRIGKTRNQLMANREPGVLRRGKTQTLPDLVVKFQPIDIVGFIL